MSSYKVISVPDVEQTPGDISFKGGVPNLPQRFDIPYCTLCGAEMPFFFQIAFPKRHVWEGRGMAFFYCTSCSDLDKGRPQLLYLKEQVHLPDSVLDTYQTNFRIYVFDADEPVTLRHDFAKRIEFERLDFERADPRVKYYDTTKVGGEPAWERDIGDATGENEDLYKEITYMGGRVVFLMQVEYDWRFVKLPDAPPQMTLPNHYTKAPTYAPFNGSTMKFFGTTSSKLDPPQALLYLL